MENEISKLVENSLKQSVEKVVVYKTSKYKAINYFYKLFRVKDKRKKGNYTKIIPINTGHNVITTIHAD